MPEFPGRLRPPRISGAPGGPAAGEMYYDTGLSMLYYYNGTTWVPVEPIATCRARGTADQACASAATTVLAFPAEDWDSSNMHDLVTNNSRITVPIAGVYTIVGAGLLLAGTTATAGSYMRLRRNGTSYESDISCNFPAVSSQIRFNVAAQMRCAANDYIELCFFNNSGASVTAQFSAPFPYLAATLVAAY